MKKKRLNKVIVDYLSERGEDYFKFNDVLNLMKLVRKQTLIECANKAKADYYIFGNSDDEKRIESYDLSNLNFHVLKESILQLDKDSIEI